MQKGKLRDTGAEDPACLEALWEACMPLYSWLQQKEIFNGSTPQLNSVEVLQLMCKHLREGGEGEIGTCSLVPAGAASWCFDLELAIFVDETLATRLVSSC